MVGMLMIAALGVAQEPAAIDSSRAPRLRNPEAVVTYRDYPAASLRRNEHGIVTAWLRVSAAGKVTACDVTESSGSPALDRTTCSLLKERARFEPAKDAAGISVEGEYRLANSWGVDGYQPRTSIDVPLQVSVIPPDYRSPVAARLVFDAAGRVEACEITATSGSAAADRAACTYVGQQLVIAPPRSGSRAVPEAAVRYLTASLSARAGAPSATR